MLFSNLLLSTAALVLGATATTVTHVKLETHTLTVHHSAATARPFGNSHSSKYFKQHHRVEAKKSKSHSKKVSKGTKSSKKGHQTLTKKSEKKCATTTHPSTKTASPSKKKKETSKASRKKVSSVASKKKHHSTATKKTHHAPTSTKNKSTSSVKATTTKKAKKTTSRASKTAVVSKTASQQPILIASPSSSLSQLAKDSLQAHNDLRAKHKVAALTWNNDLASAAQAWTDKCIYQHGQGKNIGAGENIAAYTGSDNVLGAISMWSDEVSQYNFNSPGYSDSTGHFTQQVWKATTEIGCAQTLCSSLTMPGKPSWSNAYYYVCEYKQGGNIVGSTAEDTAKIFSANVFA